MASQRSERESERSPEPGGEAGADIPSLVQEIRPHRRGAAVVHQRLQRAGRQKVVHHLPHDTRDRFRQKISGRDELPGTEAAQNNYTQWFVLPTPPAS